MEPILIFLYVYMFVIGSCIASFINVVIYRVPLGINIAKGRSFCPKCHKTLKPYDMIPVLSWFILGGKCRFCKEPISKRYPIIEFIGGVLGVLCFYHYGIDGMTLISFSLSMVLLAITMIDLDTMTIPNSLVICCVVIAILSIMFHNISMVDRVIGFFIISVPMYVMNLIIPDCFGGGDIKLIAVCGFMLGWQMTLLAMFIAILVGGIYACYLVISKKAKKGAHMAFGPYICLGITLALFYGPQIVNAYLSLFGLV